MCERVSERECVRECVCARVMQTCVRVSERERARARERLCVCVFARAHEGGKETTRDARDFNTFYSKRTHSIVRGHIREGERPPEMPVTSTPI